MTGTLEGLTMKADELAEAENKLTVEVDGLRKRTEEGRLFTTENFFRMNGSLSRFFAHSDLIRQNSS